MNKQKVNVYAESEVLNGKRHQEVYDYIISTSDFNIHDVAEHVRKIPTLEKRKKYNTLNNLLLFLILVAILDRLLLIINPLLQGHNDIGLAFLFPVLNIVLFFVVYKYKRNAHLSAGFLFMFSSFFSIAKLFSHPDLFLILSIITSLVAAALSFFLSIKLVSDYIIDKEKRTNNPNQREGMITFIEN